MRIRHSEIFGSFQGEALHAGMPSVWLRFFGCNLECNFFGQPPEAKVDDPSTWKLPYMDLDLSQYKKMEDLPVFPYGCDSSYSWSARYKGLAYDRSEQEICDIMLKILKDDFSCDKHWSHPKTGQKVQLCFTGGEPMMQQKAMAAIFAELDKREARPQQITIETNGTKPLQEKFMADIANRTNLHFACSPKLYHVSGEKDAVNIDNLMMYHGYARTGLLKFVVNGTQEAWDELDSYVSKARRVLPHWPIWIMPAGATKEQQEGPKVAEIAREGMRRGYLIATRNHCATFGNSLGT